MSNNFTILIAAAVGLFVFSKSAKTNAPGSNHKLGNNTSPAATLAPMIGGVGVIANNADRPNLFNYSSPVPLPKFASGYEEHMGGVVHHKPLSFLRLSDPRGENAVTGQLYVDNGFDEYGVPYKGGARSNDYKGASAVN